MKSLEFPHSFVCYSIIKLTSYSTGSFPSIPLFPATLYLLIFEYILKCNRNYCRIIYLHDLYCINFILCARAPFFSLLLHFYINRVLVNGVLKNFIYLLACFSSSVSCVCFYQYIHNRYQNNFMLVVEVERERYVHMLL